jgi:hypothetical protein
MAGTIATTTSGSTQRTTPPRTTYTLRLAPGQYSTSTAAPPRGFNRAQRMRVAGLVSGGAQQVNVPKPLPAFLGNSSVILVMWLAAMALISADEWRSNHILPRPARLWYTTLVYGILAITGNSNVLLPLATVLAIGYTIVLGYQFFNKTGQFS